MEIKIDGPEPIRMTPGSAGYDLRAQADFVLESTCTHTVNCCLKIEREDDLDALHDLLSDCAWDIDMAADEMADWTKPEEMDDGSD